MCLGLRADPRPDASELESESRGPSAVELSFRCAVMEQSRTGLVVEVKMLEFFDCHHLLGSDLGMNVYVDDSPGRICIVDDCYGC